MYLNWDKPYIHLYLSLQMSNILDTSPKSFFHVISKLLIECNIGTTFPISCMSPTYITKKLVGLPPIFQHTYIVHLYLIKSNILTVPSIIDVPTLHKLSEFIKAFALLLEITVLDSVCQQQESEQASLIATCWVIPIGASTIVHTWLMFRESILDDNISGQMLESLLITIFEWVE